jgi:type II secretory pathway predicted ATPase ExeA
LLVVENTQGMTPATLGILCDLVALKVQDVSALKVVLASDRSMAVMVRAPAMKCVAERQTGSFFLESMTSNETGDYLYTKLHAAGADKPERIFAPATCEEL